MGGKVQGSRDATQGGDGGGGADDKRRWWCLPVVVVLQDVEIQRLTIMLKRMDDEALTQRKEYDQVRRRPRVAEASPNTRRDIAEWICMSLFLVDTRCLT